MGLMQIDSNGRLTLKPDAFRVAVFPESTKKPVITAKTDTDLAAGARSIGIDTTVRVRQGERGTMTPITIRNSGKSSTEAVVMERLPKLADAVRAKTGWPLDLTGVRFEFVDSRTLQKRSLVDTMKTTLGMSDTEITAEMANWEPDVHGSAAVALKGERTVLLNVDALDHLDADAVSQCAFHELVHVAQRDRYPDYFAELDRLAAAHSRATVAYAEANPTVDFDDIVLVPHVAELNDRFQSRMSLVEGQAIALQNEFAQDLSGGRLAFSLPEDWPDGVKMQQYVAGADAFQVMRASGCVDLAFQQPAFVTDVLLRTRGEVVVALAGADEAFQNQTRRMVSAFQARNPHGRAITVRFDFS